jgi:23S rRNA (pseudouridine1915-N3)-methyltransferase
MTRIRILAVGGIKEDYVAQGIHEYMKRMKNKRIEIIELSDSSKKEEGEEILGKIEELKRFKTIALDEHGKELTSIEFAKFFKDNINQNLCFIIGGPDGLDKSVLDKVDYTFAISRMTLTHEMARLFLIEQIYRAFSIIKGKTYHRY